MRIGVACVMQESNSFAPIPSSLADFSIQKGSALIAANQNTNTEVGGFLAELEKLGAEAVPLISAWAISGGPVDDLTFESLANRLAEQLQGEKLDGLLLALHGAWLSFSHRSADAELVRRVRQVTGEKTPIVVTLDFHANVSPALLTGIQGLVGYRTYPHVDMGDTGRAAAQMIHRILVEQLRPVFYWMALPLIAPPQIATTDQPSIKEVMAFLDNDSGSEAILSASFFCVQPWLDMEGVASSVVVVASMPDPNIPAKMRSIGQFVWESRNEFQVEWTTPDELIPRVLRETYRPVLVSEAFDAPTGGAIGDHPGLLSILYSQRDALSACIFLVDAEAASQAHHLGVGSSFTGTLGAKQDNRFGAPISVEGRVLNLSSGEFSLKGPVFKGKTVQLGPAAVLESGRLKIVVASRPGLVIDPELYRSQNIEPRDQDLIGVKSPTLFRPGYASMLGCILHLDMPGVCRGNLAKVPFVKINRPIWPLDSFSWEASRQAVFSSGQG